MATLSKFQNVNASTTVNTDFVPSDGQKIYLRKLSTQAPSNGSAKGYLIWDPSGENRIIDSWTGDKVIDFPEETDFILIGDGNKILRLQLQNTATLSASPIGGLIIYELG